MIMFKQITINVLVFSYWEEILKRNPSISLAPVTGIISMKLWKLSHQQREGRRGGVGFHR
jgi:hypothetical protein